MAATEEIVTIRPQRVRIIGKVTGRSPAVATALSKRGRASKMTALPLSVRAALPFEKWISQAGRCAEEPRSYPGHRSQYCLGGRQVFMSM